MTTTTTLDAILTENKVTFAQVAKVTLIESNGSRYAKVESSKNDGTEYTVSYNPVFGKLTCTCAAGIDGNGCWHRRATVAQIAIDKMETRAIVEACKTDPTIPQTVEEAEEAEKPRYVKANARYGGIVDAKAQERNNERGVFHFMR